MFCKFCGENIGAVAANFCPGCGKDVNSSNGVGSSASLVAEQSTSLGGSGIGPSTSYGPGPSTSTGSSRNNDFTQITPSGNIATSATYTPRKYTFWKEGPRACPPYKKSKLENTRKQSVMKPFTLTDINTEGDMEEITSVVVNLTELEKINKHFGVIELSVEVGKLLAHPGTFILLYKGGLPIKDNPSTRGMDKWNNKQLIRIMDSDIFKRWKPNGYNYIKIDYGITDYDELELPALADLYSPLISSSTCDSSIKPTQAISTGLHEDSQVSTLESLTAEVDSLKDTLKSSVEVLNTTIRERNSGDILNKLERIFRCVICFEAKPNAYYACPHCGRYLGCFDCLKRIEKCPLCRASFKCCLCSHSLKRKAYFIPGIEEIIPVAPRNPGPSSSSTSSTFTRPNSPVDADDNSGALDDTLPIDE